MKQREAFKIFAQEGFVFLRERGDHMIFKSVNTGVLLVFPRHHKEVGTRYVNSLLSSAKRAEHAIYE